jgi:anti-sigma B factor antagonist
VSRRPKVPSLAVVGELTIQTAAENKAALLALLESAGEVEVVLTDVTELDTAGLQVLMLARREAAHVGKSLRLVCANKVVTDVLEIAHLTTDLEAVVGPVRAEGVDR